MTNTPEVFGHWGPSGFDPSRKTIFLVHGAGGSALPWQVLHRGLDGNFNVCALELPGHGETPGPALDKVEAYASWVAQQIDKSGVAPVILAGHSMGGAIAMTIALERSDLLAGMVLLNTGARLRVLPAILDGLADKFKDTVGMIVDFAYRKGVDKATKAIGVEQFITAGPQTVLGDFTACNRFDVTGRLGEVKTPTLVITGQDDVLAPPKFSEFLKDNIAGARLLIIEDCGHMTMIERVDEVAEAIDRFVGSF